jgi:phosphonopyruvate decarboxylase
MSVEPQQFLKNIKKLKLAPLLMVPCSIFKPLNNCILSEKTEIIFPPNEAHAMGFAVGSFLATGQPAVIFLQNSGLNNLANAQTSLNLIYKIPVLLIVSWRGDPSKKDAPEHQIMGKIMEDYFKVLKIPFLVLSKDWQNQLKRMMEKCKKERLPVAIVIRDDFFSKNQSTGISHDNKNYSLSRMEAIKTIKNNLKDKVVFVSTNGFISRDSFAVSPTNDFYLMGSMGHAFSVGVGLTWQLSQKKSKLRTVVLDGDGGSLMHLGSLSLIGLEKIKKSNLIYIVLDNEAYDSTGEQPTLSSQINFLKIAEGFGFPQRFLVKNKKDLEMVIKKLKTGQAAFIQIKINLQKENIGIRVSDKYSCEEITKRFKKNFLRKKL